MSEELEPLKFSEELQPIPYKDLRRGYYWCRIEKNGTWWVWQVALVDIVRPNIEIRFAFADTDEKPYICGMHYEPPAGNGVFFYAKLEPPPGYPSGEK